MRVYLSSFRLGLYGHRLRELVGGGRVAVIMNAVDAAPPSHRQRLLERNADDFAALDMEVEEIDLRRYFSAPDGLIEELADFDLVWASGGNSFTLMMAMTQSGFVDGIKRLLDEDIVAYGGYSAGAVVAGSTLRGIDLVDSAEPSEAAPEGYLREIRWNGLGLVDYSVVPHYRSDHPESRAVEKVVGYLTDRNAPYRPMRDGEVIVVDGAEQAFLRLPPSTNPGP